MHNDGNTCAVLLDGLLQRRPRFATVRADRVEERLHQYRSTPCWGRPAIHEPIRPRWNWYLVEATTARPAPDNDKP
jgi:hypothetical protein